MTATIQCSVVVFCNALLFLSFAKGNNILTTTTVGHMIPYFYSAAEPPCILTFSIMNSCHYTSIECVASCMNTPSCVYATTEQNYCLRCIGASETVDSQVYDAVLDATTVVYAKVEAELLGSQATALECDVELTNNGIGGYEFSDAEFAEGRTLTRIDLCMRSGEIHGYRAYYDSEAQTARGCDWASASVTFEPEEAVMRIDVYTSGLSRGFTFYTNQGSTYGPYGLTTGNLETVEGINLEYIYGRAGGSLDVVNFHFTAC